MTDPLLHGGYGPELAALDPAYDGRDRDRIAQLSGAIDWLGVNY